MLTGPWMTQFSSFNQFGTKSEQISQFTLKFHRVKMCFSFLSTPLTLIEIIHTNLIYLDLIMPKLVYLMTVQEAHKEFNTLTDQIWAKYELLDSGECGKVGTPTFDAECSKLSHLMAHMSNLCKHLKLPMHKDLHRPPHFKH